jgi:hypothetical protein
MRSPVSDSARCQARSKRSGEQCRKSAMRGLTVCKTHGGAAPAAAQKSALARAQHEISKHVRVEPIAADDWEAHPIHSFEMEFRRSIAWIRYYQEKIAELTHRELVWGVSKIEDKTATEFAGEDITMEAKPNIYVELLFRERKHLLELQKTFIAGGIAAKVAASQSAHIDRIELSMNALIVALGHDPSDPEIRNTVRQTLLGIGKAA